MIQDIKVCISVIKKKNRSGWGWVRRQISMYGHRQKMIHLLKLAFNNKMAGSHATLIGDESRLHYFWSLELDLASTAENSLNLTFD